MEGDKMRMLYQHIKPLYPTLGFDGLNKRLNGCNTTKVGTNRTFDVYYENEWFCVWEDEDGIAVGEIYRFSISMAVRHFFARLRLSFRKIVSNHKRVNLTGGK